MFADALMTPRGTEGTVRDPFVLERIVEEHGAHARHQGRRARAAINARRLAVDEVARRERFNAHLAAEHLAKTKRKLQRGLLAAAAAAGAGSSSAGGGGYGSGRGRDGGFGSGLGGGNGLFALSEAAVDPRRRMHCSTARCEVVDVGGWMEGELHREAEAAEAERAAKRAARRAAKAAEGPSGTVVTSLPSSVVGSALTTPSASPRGRLITHAAASAEALTALRRAGLRSAADAQRKNMFLAKPQQRTVDGNVERGTGSEAPSMPLGGNSPPFSAFDCAGDAGAAESGIGARRRRSTASVSSAALRTDTFPTTPTDADGITSIASRGSHSVVVSGPFPPPPASGGGGGTSPLSQPQSLTSSPNRRSSLWAPRRQSSVNPNLHSVGGGGGGNSSSASTSVLVQVGGGGPPSGSAAVRPTPPPSLAGGSRRRHSLASSSSETASFPRQPQPHPLGDGSIGNPSSPSPTSFSELQSQASPLVGGEGGSASFRSAGEPFPARREVRGSDDPLRHQPQRKRVSLLLPTASSSTTPDRAAPSPRGGSRPTNGNSPETNTHKSVSQNSGGSVADHQRRALPPSRGGRGTSGGRDREDVPSPQSATASPDAAASVVIPRPPRALSLSAFASTLLPGDRDDGYDHAITSHANKMRSVVGGAHHRRSGAPSPTNAASARLTASGKGAGPEAEGEIASTTHPTTPRPPQQRQSSPRGAAKASSAASIRLNAVDEASAAGGGGRRPISSTSGVLPSAGTQQTPIHRSNHHHPLQQQRPAAPQQPHPPPPLVLNGLAIPASEATQLAADFLFLSYGRSHILIREAAENGPDTKFRAGVRGFFFYELTTFAAREGLAEVSFADFCRLTYGLTAAQTAQMVRRFSLARVQWCLGLSWRVAETVHEAYNAITAAPSTDEDAVSEESEEFEGGMADTSLHRPVTFERLRSYVSSAVDGKTMKEGDLRRIFSRADADGDGVLSKAEFATLFALIR